MYNLRGMFFSSTVTYEEFGKFSYDKKPLPVNKDRFKDLDIEFVWDSTKQILFPVLDKLVKKADGWYELKEGQTYIQIISDRIEQHNVCCGSIFISDIRTETDFIWVSKNRERNIIIKLPSAEDRLNLYIDMMRFAGYSTIQYIVTSNQKKMRDILDKLGFKCIHSVKNTRSGNMLHFMQLDL